MAEKTYPQILTETAVIKNQLEALKKQYIAEREDIVKSLRDEYMTKRTTATKNLTDAYNAKKRDLVKKQRIFKEQLYNSAMNQMSGKTVIHDDNNYGWELKKQDYLIEKLKTGTNK